MVPSGRRFSIHVCLGRGGFGEVYRATMASSGGVTSEVAVKILRADIDPGSEAVKRLRDEGRLLGALRHPAILRVHDLVILDRRVALVTEYVDGQDLDACIHASPPMPPRVLFSVIGEVASALNVAFNAPAPGQSGPMHLVHRDVKPANIRIGRHGEVKLLDFGIARAANMTREAQTANNAMMGSSHYMAPERFHEDDVFPPSDVYALGCIVFEGLTGERFFGDRSMKQIYGTMLSPRKYGEHLGERLQALGSQPQVVQSMVARLLAGDPDERPDASVVAGAFEDLAEDTAGPTLKRWCRNREWPASDAAHGSLSGRELEAQSFVSTRPPTPLPGGSPLDDPLASPGLLSGGDLLGAPGWFGEDPLAPVAPSTAPVPSPPPTAPASNPPPVRPLPEPEEPAPPVAAEPPSRAHGLGASPGPLPRRDDDSMEAPMPRVATPLAAERVTPPTPSPEPPVIADAAPPAPAPAPLPSAPPVAAPPSPPDVPSVTPQAEVVASELPPQPHREMPASIPRFDDEPGFPTPQPARRTPGDTIAPGDFSSDEGDWLGDAPGPAPEPIAGVFDEPLVMFGSGDADDADFDRELKAMAARRAQRNRMVMLAVVAVAALLLLAGGGIYATGLLGDGGGGADGDGDLTAAPATEPAPKPEAAPAAGSDDEKAAAAPAAEPALAPKPKAADKPAPPKPAAPPAPAPPKPAAPPAPAPKASASALVDRGWAAVSGSPNKALTYFEQALERKPGDAEASYGLGYALLQLGRAPEAKPHLCRALRSGSTQTRRDVQGMLGQNSMSCD